MNAKWRLLAAGVLALLGITSAASPAIAGKTSFTPSISCVDGAGAAGKSQLSTNVPAGTEYVTVSSARRGHGTMYASGNLNSGHIDLVSGYICSTAPMWITYIQGTRILFTYQINR